jgi:hypothetical protein
MIHSLRDLLHKWFPQSESRVSPVVEEDPPPTAPELPRMVTKGELVALSVLQHEKPRETVLLTVTQRLKAGRPTEEYFLKDWPFKVVAKNIEDNSFMQRMVLIPYRYEKYSGTLRMSRMKLSNDWVVRMVSCDPEVDNGVPAEMFLRFDDPQQVMVQPLTGLLTPVGNKVLKTICMMTTSSVLEYHAVAGNTFVRLKPGQARDVYKSISEVAKDIASK